MGRTNLTHPAIYYPPEILGKMMWAQLPEYSPETAFLAQSFSLSGNQITELLATLYQTRDVFDTACEWVKNNEQIWENWIRPCKFSNYRLPYE